MVCVITLYFIQIIILFYFIYYSVQMFIYILFVTGVIYWFKSFNGMNGWLRGWQLVLFVKHYRLFISFFFVHETYYICVLCTFGFLSNIIMSLSYLLFDSWLCRGLSCTCFLFMFENWGSQEVLAYHHYTQDCFLPLSQEC